MAQSHGPKAELSQGRQTADKSKAAKRRRRKVRRLKPAPITWSGLTDFRKAKSGKPDGAKSWVYNHKIIFRDHDRQTAEEQIFSQGWPKVVSSLFDSEQFT